MKKNNPTLIARAIVRVTLIIATLVALAIGTFHVVPVAGKITWTQVKMAWFYSSIKSCEKDRDIHEATAQSYLDEGYVMAAKSEQNQANGLDSEIDVIKAARRALQADSDPIVKWAAKNQIELPVLLLGLAMFTGVAAAWVFCWKKLFNILQIEELAIAFILYGIAAIFTVFGGLFGGLADFVDKDCAELQKANSKTWVRRRQRRRHHNIKIVPMQKRKVG